MTPSRTTKARGENPAFRCRPADHANDAIWAGAKLFATDEAPGAPTIEHRACRSCGERITRPILTPTYLAAELANLLAAVPIGLDHYLDGLPPFASFEASALDDTKAVTVGIRFDLEAGLGKRGRTLQGRFFDGLRVYVVPPKL